MTRKLKALPYDVFPDSSIAQLVAQYTAIGGPATLKLWRDEKGRLMMQLRKVRPAGAAASNDDPDPPPIDDSFTCPGSPRCP